MIELTNRETYDALDKALVSKFKFYASVKIILDIDKYPLTHFPTGKFD